jgi:integrase
VVACRARGNKAKTINLKLAVVRRILNLAATSWRDERTGLTWLQQSPKITMLPVRDARSPYPLSWVEQRLLFGLLPAHLHRMALFAVHTGARDEEICSLRWEDEVEIPELQTFVFALPTSKNGLPRLIVLNGVARSVVEQCRGEHAEYVFVYSAAEVAELIAAVSKIEGGESAPVLTLIRASDMGQNRGTKKQAA